MAVFLVFGHDGRQKVRQLGYKIIISIRECFYERNLHYVVKDIYDRDFWQEELYGVIEGIGRFVMRRKRGLLLENDVEGFRYVRGLTYSRLNIGSIPSEILKKDKEGCKSGQVIFCGGKSRLLLYCTVLRGGRIKDLVQGHGNVFMDALSSDFLLTFR